jgi:tripartite-type tricarboxylate transporter receptor subunit TctC
MRLRRRNFLRLAAGAAALPVMPRLVRADTYPSRPVHILCGFAPGGAADTVARLTAEWLSEQLGQQFVVDNRPGAGTNIATEMAVQSAPDGYTLLLVTGSNAINATLYRHLNFDFLRDMAPVAGVIRVPQVMVVNPQLPAKTVAEFIDYAKANPGELSMASSGVGASPHLSGEYFKSLAKIDMVHVPYRGSGAAYPDLISGKVQVLFDNLGGPALQMVRSGQLRALAVTSAKRWPLLPDLPTIAETVPGYDVDVWYGMFAPKNTPPEIVKQLNAALANVVADPQIAARFAQDGGLPSPMPVESLGKFLRDDQARWRKMVEAAGLTAE